jgi:hypothetical protein
MRTGRSAAAADRLLAGLGGSYEEFIWSVINREER